MPNKFLRRNNVESKSGNATKSVSDNNMITILYNNIMTWKHDYIIRHNCMII